MSWQALSGSNGSSVKSHNLTAILFALLRHEPISRVRLAQLTGLSSTTITNLISELLNQGIVAEEGTVKSGDRRSVGRPRTALRLVPLARHAIGIHIGVGSIRVAVTDLRSKPLVKQSMAHPIERSPEAVLSETAALVEKMIAQAGIDRRNIVGVGVGASGLVDPHTGINVVAPNLGWHVVPIRDWLTEHLELPVTVDNNVRAMALGEALFGAGQEARSLAFVYARIGVGAGFVVDGQVYRGSAAGAGEIGHTTIIPNGGKLCRCGNTGCLETLLSEPGIIQQAQELARRRPEGILAAKLENGEGTTIERIFDAARDADEETCAMLNDKARYLGIALANLVNVFNPELILLGGFLLQGADLLIPVADATMRQCAFANLGEQVQLQTATFGREAGAVGAAAFALNAFFYQQRETGYEIDRIQRAHEIS